MERGRPDGCGSDGYTHSEGPKASIPCMWEENRPGEKSLAGVAAAGVPKSLSPRPVPGSEAQHWYKGWETGP